MQHKRYLISGRVQGVSYRRFAEREANLLGVSGLARNLKDGRVEVLAAGTYERLTVFEARLSVGPTLSEVKSIEKEDVPASEFQDKIEADIFKVSVDGESPYEFNR